MAQATTSASDLVQLIQDADFAVMDIETTRMAFEASKTAVEFAKEDYERAKKTFDQVIAQADELGIPRAKLRKLVEERSAALLASGLLSVPVNKAARPKPAAKKAKAPGAGAGSGAGSGAGAGAKKGVDVPGDGADVIRLDA